MLDLIFIYFVISCPCLLYAFKVLCVLADHNNHACDPHQKRLWRIPTGRHPAVICKECRLKNHLLLLLLLLLRLLMDSTPFSIWQVVPGGIDALVSTMELNAITFWKNMVKHESRRRRHIKTNLDKKWIILQSTHLQNEPCIHLVSLQDSSYDKCWSEEATSKIPNFLDLFHMHYYASPTYSFNSTTWACSQLQVSSQACS